MELVTEVPVETDELTLGVAIDPLTVAAELWVVLGQQQQAGVDPRAEGIDESLVAEMGPNFPVRSDRTEVHNGCVSNRRLVGERLDVGHGEQL